MKKKIEITMMQWKQLKKHSVRLLALATTGLLLMSGLAACGAGAGITYMYGGTYQQVSLTIINTLGNIGGIVCDGAKPSCAAKIATSVDAALMAFQLSIQNKSFLPGEGIIKDDIEETIKSMGYIGRVGMRTTDTEILNVMIDRADINEEC